MRPALQALASQQQLIEQIRKDATRQVQEARDTATALRTAVGQALSRKDQEIAALTRGLHAIAQAAGIEDRVRTAMRKRADEQNPAQPVPDPPPEPSPHSTVETETPEAFADVLAPGMVPGSTNDVAADATSTVYTPGDDIPGPAIKELVDVTRPVDGTQGPRPTNEVRTETDVRVGNPMNPQTAFPLRGDFSNAQRLSSTQNGPQSENNTSNRTMASLRLARLRMQAGTAQGESDFEVATDIEKDAGLTTEAIEREIATLEGVSKAASKRAAAPRQLVPQRPAGGVARTVPSMQATAATAGASGSDEDVRDADLFE